MSSDVAEMQLTLADLNNVDQALEYARTQGEVIVAGEIGDDDGFKFVEDKSRLEGTHFVVVDVSAINSEKFGEGVTVKFITKGGYRGKFSDFSTGIKNQLVKLITRYPNLSGIECPRGLVRSEYDTEVDINGKTTKVHGVTYYLDTAPAETGHIV